MTYALASKLRRGRDMVPLIGRTVQSVANLVNNRRDPEGAVGAVPLTAPHTPWNGSISPKRSVAFARISLEELKDVRRALDVKVNDVVLAVVRRHAAQLPHGARRNARRAAAGGVPRVGPFRGRGR